MPTSSNKYQTIIVLQTAMLVFYMFQHKFAFLVVAMILGGVAILSAKAVDYIHFGWMKLAHGMGLISNTIILGVVFILIVIPTGFLKRIFSKKNNTEKTSSFKERKYLYTKKDFENPW
ncbi:MAG: SxtJ family membrane protein [Ferruginibacter sp.]